MLRTQNVRRQSVSSGNQQPLSSISKTACLFCHVPSNQQHHYRQSALLREQFRHEICLGPNSTPLYLALMYTCTRICTVSAAVYMCSWHCQSDSLGLTVTVRYNPNCSNEKHTIKCSFTPRSVELMGIHSLRICAAKRTFFS
jgi:hypothetical protein